jgi:hypothetical protein
MRNLEDVIWFKLFKTESVNKEADNDEWNAKAASARVE